MKIAILEDDSRRIRRMVRCLQERFPSCEAAVFDGTPEMIGWLNDLPARSPVDLSRP